MAKHRGSVYVVVREEKYDADNPIWQFSGLIGTYATLMRAEEIAGACSQNIRDMGFTEDNFRFTVEISTYYDE